MIGLLTQLTEKHKIELSVIKTGHGQFTSGGSVSNHFVGRGIDIARVDGEIVNAGSTAARELATEIAALKGDLRPTEVGSPWAIAASGFFTDGGHQDHLHVAYDGEPPAGFELPASKGAPAAAADPAAAAPAVAPAAPVAAAAAAPAAPVAAAAAPPEPKAGDSGQFLAAKAHAASVKKGASGTFLAASPSAPPAATAAAAPPGAADAVAGAADLAGIGDAYPGDDAPKEQLAAWLGKQAEKRGLPKELPVMAALVESGVKNLNFGDADSVGFFQMRVGIWNQGEYAGYPEKPELQAKWFLDQAEAVKKQRISRGQPVDDPSQFGEWIADVERPAEQYRGRYQLRLDEARGLLSKAAESAPPAAAADPAAVAPVAPVAAVADVAASGTSRPPDPSEYGLDGTGGKPTPEMEALLKNKNITFDATGIADIKAGKIDPRVIAVMTKLSEDHKITVTCMCSDHSRATAGGSISNHSLGRGLDIGTIDGEIVRPNSAAARELASELSQLPEEYRPNEIGSPFAIAGPGYFTDSAHQDHIHLGFKQEISKDWRPPADVAAGGSAGAPAAAAAAVPGAAAVPATPGSPVAAAAAPAPPKPGASGQFLAAKPDSAIKKGDSGAFMAVRPLGPASALADPAAVPAAVDAAAAAAPGSGSSTLGAAALKTAETQLGVKEEGTNTGAKVDEYLKAAGVPPGNPWCASFVTWALAQNGHKMEGGGWAAVQTWVRNAEAGKNDLQIVSAEDARPGDIVTYDWGGQDDFGADGHIGFLKSAVKDGKFTALEGNNQDAVMNVPRQTSGANVKFIRIGGEAPAPAAPAGAAPAATPAGGVADAAAAAAGGSGGSGRYPGDNASKAQLAAWMGREAEKRGLPKQLPVMAALVESGVKNLNFGDADSVGFFQMRVGIWNQGAYKGYPEKPELQVKWFLDQAEAVKKQRLARGQSVTDPKQFGEWIADVERPAAQYRGRYAMRLGEANGLLANAGSAPAAAEQVAAAPPAAAAVDAAASAAGGGGAGPKALAALKEAQKYTGTAYRWGGSTPQTGFDCSGLVQWAYAKAGVQLPRVTDAQFAAGNGEPVDRGKLLPGDLVFFGKPGNIYHVGISMGGDKFLHAPKTGDVVKVASLSDSYFSQNFAGGRRFDEASGVAGAAAVPAAPAAGAAAAIDPKAVAEAQAALARDAAEVNRGNSGLFMAVKAQEERRHKTVQFMKAIDPNEAKAAAAAPAAAPPAAAAAPAAAAPAATPVDAGEPIQLPDDISDDYPGNNASKDELAKWLAKQADKHGLPPELPVMASLVESGVKNLNFGDADSVGFFQMRVGIWNQGDYKGYPEHPELQAKWFIDQALAVKKQAIARGDADFGKDPSKWGEWIADIERPAEQYRGRYQLRLKEARGLLS